MPTAVKDLSSVDEQRDDAKIARVDGEVSPETIEGTRAELHGSFSGVFRSLPHEDEDSRMNGGTRSLMRRLLGLNLFGSVPAPEVARQEDSPVGRAEGNSDHIDGRARPRT